MKTIKIKTYIFLILLPQILLIISCGNKEKKENNTQTTSKGEFEVSLTPEQLKNTGIIIGTTTKRNISEKLKLNGKIDVPPQNMVSISVPLGGYLKSTKLLPGMHITKGEVLAQMEDKQYIQLQEEYLTIKNKLFFAEKDFERQKELNKSKANSDKIFEIAQNEYLTRKIEVKSLSEKLKLIGISPESLNENNISKSINITSPIEGYVSKVNVNIGKYVNATDVLFELVNPDDIHLALSVFEKDISKLFIGQKLLAFTNNETNKKHPCEIILIGQNFSEDKSVEVHCHFLDYDKTLIPGMFMNAEVNLETKECSTLPENAIVAIDGKNYIFVQKSEMEYLAKEIEIGKSEKGFTEVQLKNEDISILKNIVLDGAYNLLMKMKNKEE